MALNTSKQAIIDKRRQAVAQMRLRGATQREIEEQLNKTGFINPDTGNPWSLGIINKDLQELEKEWRESAKADMADLKGQQLAEIRAGRRKAWSDGDLNNVRQFMKLEIDLLGTDAPKKFQEVTWQDEIVAALRAGEIDAETISAWYPDLAGDFFKKAGVDATT